MTSTIRAVQVSQINAPLRVIDLPKPSPGRGQVRIAVEACGICGSDASMVQGVFGDGPFPLTPGHEIAGRIDMLGDPCRRLGTRRPGGRGLVRRQRRQLSGLPRG